MIQLFVRVRRSTAASLWLALIVACFSISASAQRGGGTTSSPIPFGDGHMIFGDLKIVGSGAEAEAATFQVVLYAGVNIVQRQPVSKDGRFRFMGIPNGEYALAVEYDGREVYRDPFRLAERQKTDIRKDITLEMRFTPTSDAPRSTGLYQRSPANQALLDRARKATEHDNLTEARKLLEQIVGNDPEDFVSWAELGSILFREGKYSDADKAYQRALAGKPDFLVVLVNLGKVRIAQKNFDGAIESLTKAVEVDPKSADAHHYLGEAYLQTKKGSKAVVHFTEALKLDPTGKAEVHLRLGVLYNAAGMKDRAASEYQQFLTKRPDYAEKAKLQEYINQNQKP